MTKQNLNNICKVKECNKKSIAKKLCSKHYYYFHRYGNFDPIKCQCCGRRSVFFRSKTWHYKKIKSEKFTIGTICSNCYRYVLRAYAIFKLGSKCSCCKEKKEDFLAIDHKYGGGHQERKSLNQYLYYENIIKNLKKYQLLCHNCNVGKYRNNGTCPHKS